MKCSRKQQFCDLGGPWKGKGFSCAMLEHFFLDSLHHKTVLRKFHQGRSHNAAKIVELKSQSSELLYLVVPKHVLFLCFKHEKNSRWEQLRSKDMLLKLWFINITLSTCENFNIRHYHQTRPTWRQLQRTRDFEEWYSKSHPLKFSQPIGGYMVLTLDSHAAEE